MSEFMRYPSGSTMDCVGRRVIVLCGKIIIVTDNRLIALDGTDLTKSCPELSYYQTFSTVAVSDNGQYAVFASMMDFDLCVYVTDGTKWLCHRRAVSDRWRFRYTSSWISNDGKSVFLGWCALDLYRCDEAGLRHRNTYEYNLGRIYNLSAETPKNFNGESELFVIRSSDSTGLTYCFSGEYIPDLETGRYQMNTYWSSQGSSETIILGNVNMRQSFVVQHISKENGVPRYTLLRVQSTSELPSIDEERELSGSTGYTNFVTFYSQRGEPCLFLGRTHSGHLSFYGLDQLQYGGLQWLGRPLIVPKNDRAIDMSISTTLRENGTQSLVVLGRKGVSIFDANEISWRAEMAI